MLVDATTRDDAAVFRLADNRAVVATVDFFTPIVDDPYTFGAIAAANAFSDLYAMGARPLFALNLVAWPRQPEILALLGDTLRGGADVAARAGALILGGHSIDDTEPKYGMVAIGDAAPGNIITNAGARPGDRLVLTKPLGTGILSTALKREVITEADMHQAIGSMTTLNAAAMDAMLAAGSAVHACTDITGYGLLGHLHEMLAASGCSADLHAATVPVFDQALDLAARDVIPGGTARNREGADEFVRWNASCAAPLRVLLADAQTSGGLLIAVAEPACGPLVADLTARGAGAFVVGTVQAGPAGAIAVT